MPREKKIDVGLPVRPFLYTLDQVATILAVEPKDVKRYIWLRYRMPGARPEDKLEACNIAPEGEKPEWRVAEKELTRWMSRRGFRVYDRSWR